MTESAFRPSWWLRGPHLQTLWGKLFRQRDLESTRVERLETPDSDFLDLHHLDAPPGAPLLMLLHGLEGTIRSHYIQGMLREARQRGWRAAVLVFRSCGGTLNRAQRFYHSGETSDLDFALTHLAASFPSSPILIAGVSLGGNVLLKYLGESGDRLHPSVKAAAAVSVPYDLSQSSRHIDKGFARVYQRHFIRSLRRKALAKLEAYPNAASRESVAAATTMFQFDDFFTAPVHGFLDAEDYYRKSSSIHYLEWISIKTLLLSAVDDPFLPAHVLDEVRSIARANPHLEVEFTPRGGHVGFVAGANPLRPIYYLEKRTGDFLAKHLQD